MLTHPGRTQNKSSENVQQNTANNKNTSNDSPVPITKLKTSNEDQNQGPRVASEYIDNSIRHPAPIPVNPTKDSWDRALVVFTGLIVIVGGFQIWFLWKTVKATSDNAEAALLNAQAMINAERARVVAELTRMSAHYEAPAGWCRFIGGSPVSMSTEEVLRGNHLLHSLKFINMGRTVAHISGYEIHCGFFNWGNGVLNIEEIDYNHDFDHMIEGSGSFVTNDEISINEFVDNPAAEVATFKTYVIVLVSVTYSHVFSDSEPQADVFRFIYDTKGMTLRRTHATEADRVQCRNGKISPLTRKTPDVSNNDGEEKKIQENPNQGSTAKQV